MTVTISRAPPRAPTRRRAQHGTRRAAVADRRSSRPEPHSRDFFHARRGRYPSVVAGPVPTISSGTVLQQVAGKEDGAKAVDCAHHRLEEDIASADLDLTAEDLRAIDMALA